MQSSPTLEQAFLRTQHASQNRRVLIMHLLDQGAMWWGGDIDHWHPDVATFPSLAVAEQCRQLLQRFRRGSSTRGHMLFVHSNGSPGAILLGAESTREVHLWLQESIPACSYVRR